MDDRAALPIDGGPFGAADPHLAEAWRLLPHAAKRALGDGIPKIPSSAVGSRIRHRLQQAILTVAAMLRYGRDAVTKDRRQSDLFMQDIPPGAAPDRCTLHIAERLMGASEADLGRCMNQLERLAHAYAEGADVNVPSMGTVDTAIMRAFSIRTRKPKPWSGDWLLGEAPSSENCVPWAEVEPVFRSNCIWGCKSDLPWYRWCWQILASAGSTAYGTAADHDRVLLRAIGIWHIYVDYCALAMDKINEFEGEDLFVRFGGNLLNWEESRYHVERDLVARTILGHYARLDEQVDEYGSRAIEVEGSIAFLEDLEATLPLIGESLEEYYANSFNWRITADPTDAEAENQFYFEERYMRILGWVKDGLVWH